MMNPAANSIEAGHDGAHDASFMFRDEQQLGLDTKLAVDHRGRCVARRVVGEDDPPERDELIAIARLV